MAHALALRAEGVLLARLEIVGVLDEHGELHESRPLRIGSALERIEPPDRLAEAAPGVARLGTTSLLVGPDEGVEQVALMGGAGESALRELAREGEQPFGCRHEIVPCDAPAPGECPRAAVGAHTARDDESRLVVRAEVAERLQPLLVEEPVGHLELGLDVRLPSGGADRRRVALRAEQEADRLRHDRLAGAGLPRERDEAR